MNFTEALQLQVSILTKIAQRLDEKGYAVVVHGLNRDGSGERYGYAYFLGAMNNFTKVIGRRIDIKPVLVHVSPKVTAALDNLELFELRRTGKIFDYGFTFTCKIPLRVRYKSIHASLALMSSKALSRYDQQQSAGTTHALRIIESIDYLEYRGYSKAGLEILLRVLDMPQHQEILRARAKPGVRVKRAAKR